MVDGDVRASQTSGMVWILHRENLSDWNTRIVTETKQGCESSEIIHFKEDLEIADDLKMYAASENNLERFMRIVNVHI